MSLAQWIADHRLLIWSAAGATLSLVTSAHVVLHKRDARAAVGWVGVIWLSPFLGSLFYLMLGINRIARQAHRLRPPVSSTAACPPARVAAAESVEPGVRDLVRLGARVSGQPLAAGNAIEPLENGDEAYPAMLAAIDGATRSVTLATYIFDRDRAGLRFAESLGRAVARGVQVRVLVDSVGARYSWPTIRGVLRRQRVPHATFLPSPLPWRLGSSNLRNHRKILVVDGREAFTGGMNIRAGHELRVAARHPVADMQFRLRGPVVRQLQEIFAIDWRFTTGEELSGELWYHCDESAGTIAARCVADGPDEDLDRIRKLFHGAVSVAQRSITLVTPYFLPDSALVTALNVAALRGVAVNIHLPERCNLRLVQWAMRGQLWQVLEHGCQVWLTPPPFDHSKLLMVDGAWSAFGSANWDPRSLRLNFEVAVECYCPELAQRLESLVARRRGASRQLTLADVDRRPLLVKLRDGAARLMTPFL